MNCDLRLWTCARLSFFCVLIATCLSCGRSSLPEHVILVTIDTLRADHLGSYGYPRDISPFLDSLAKDGVLFENAVSSSSHTAPSHASLFTSQYPASHGVVANGTQLGARVPTIASVLRDSGFQTGAVISARFLSLIATGFEEVHHKRPKPSGYWPADRVIDRAIVWLVNRDKNKRFFLWVHLYDVHSSRGEQGGPPYELLTALKEEYREDPEPLQRAWAQRGLPEQVRRRPRQIHHYDAQIAYVDSELRRLFDFVEGHEDLSNVLWVITSDHGEGLGNHGFLGHGKHLYQEQIRVPLIFYGLQEAMTVGDLVRHVDVLPTVADLVGVSHSNGDGNTEGRSLAPLLDGSEASLPPVYAYSQRRPPTEARLEAGWTSGLMISAVSEDHKYILKTGGEDEFYDLSQDPLEVNNLVNESSTEKDRMANWLASKYEEMTTSMSGEADAQVQEEFVDELRALGYL